MGAELRHLLGGHRLDDVVDVDRDAAGVGPEAVVHLGRGCQLAGDERGSRKRGPSSAASASVRSATAVTWRSGLTMSVPSPSGPTQCSTSHRSVRKIIPPGNGRRPWARSQARQSTTRVLPLLRSFRCGDPGVVAQGSVGAVRFVMVSPVRIAVGTDERAPMLDALLEHLRCSGHEVLEVADGIDWPAAGTAVGRAVVDGTAEMGLVCCTTGTGVAMAANKVRGVRAALCTDAETARGARRWNDANVLAFGLRLTSESVAKEMVDAFLDTPFDRAEAELVASLEDAKLVERTDR